MFICNTKSKAKIVLPRVTPSGQLWMLTTEASNYILYISQSESLLHLFIKQQYTYIYIAMDTSLFHNTTCMLYAIV